MSPFKRRFFFFAACVLQAHGFAAAQDGPLDAGVPPSSTVDDGGLPAHAALPEPSLLNAIDAGVPDAAAAIPLLPVPIVLPSSMPAPAAEVGAVDVTVSGERAPGPGEFARHGTGSKVNAPLEQLATTVSVIERETLRERGVTDLQNALSLLPGLTPMWTYGGFQSVQARGFQALMLFDGRRDARSILSGSSPFTGLFDLERVEVLRGPGAVLYGYGAVGGTVNLIRRRASATPLHEIELGLGTPRQFLAHVGSQGAIASKLSYRADLGHVSYRNFRDYESARSQGTTTLRWTPARHHTLQLRMSYSFDRYNTDVGIPTIQDPARPGTWMLPEGARYTNRYSTANDFLKYQRLDAGLDYRWDVTRAVYLEARAGITRDRYSYLAAESLTYVPAMNAEGAQVERGYLAFAHHFRPIQAQLELHADVATGPIEHKLVVGYSLDHMKGHTDRNGLGGANPGSVDLAWPIDRADKIALQRSSIDLRQHVMHSWYAFDHIDLTHGLILTGGGRVDAVYSSTRREFLDVETQEERPDPATMMLRRPNNTTDVAPTGQVGLVYRPIDPLIGYVSYANGYKPQFISASQTGVSRVDPELTQQFEGGLRIRVDGRDHLLEADAAGYLIRRKNLLVARGTELRVPAGLAQSRGLDLSVRYAAFRVVQLNASYSLIDAEYKDFNAPSSYLRTPDGQAAQRVDLAGNVLRVTPRHAGNFWLRVMPLQRLAFGIGSRLVGRQYADDENRLRMPRYALLDASLSYGQGRATFTLSGNNLVGRVDYFTSVINSGSLYPQVTPGPGREVLGTLRVEL